MPRSAKHWLSVLFRGVIEALKLTPLVWVGPGELWVAEQPISENTVNAALHGMGYSKHVRTAHGFRATARTIMDEVLGEMVDLIEHQLADAVKDAAHLPARRAGPTTWIICAQGGHPLLLLEMQHQPKCQICTDSLAV